jgi:hypothetical protein
MQASTFVPHASGSHGLAAAAAAPLPASADPVRVPDITTLGLALAHAVLDRVLIGVGVVDTSLHVLYANAAARSECRSSMAIRMDETGLRIKDPARHAELVRAAASASRGSWSLVHLPGEATTLAVVPLPASEGLALPTAVMVVFGLRQQTRTLAIEFFARAQGMTLRRRECFARSRKGCRRSRSPPATRWLCRRFARRSPVSASEQASKALSP